ncbi:MAG: NAD(P)-dependent alcohol dehydrogenase [Pseudomonadota bacterium]|nr:NAD(P)-dependent alcohol dehydrogenase [Pseudomonadota bacterium]
MKAVALNFRDLMVATGHDRWRPPVGRIPGSDGVGVVQSVGPGTERIKVGQRVMTTILPKWISGPLTTQKREGGLGGPAADGVMAELVLLDASGLVPAPDYLTDIEASTLPAAALTAWHALTRAGSLRPDATVLVEGTGGVSLFALQIAAAAGARVIATSSSDAKLERLSEVGAAATINYLQRPTWSHDVLALTQGRGVQHAIDIGGATTLNQSISSVGMEGVVSIVGLVGGLNAEINLAEVFQKNLRLDGIETGSRSMLEDLLTWLDAKRLHPIIDKVFAFEEAEAAFRHLKAGGHMGKVCLTLN